MTDPWSFEGVPAGLPSSSVSLIEGTTFCVSDQRGDLADLRPGGLFVRDTRILSHCELWVEDRPVEPLTVQQPAPYAAVFLGTATAGTSTARARVLTRRHRVVGDGMREEITLVNCGSRPCHVAVGLRLAADLADVFEVKDGRATGRPVSATVLTGVPTPEHAKVLSQIDPHRHGPLACLSLGTTGEYSVLAVPDAAAEVDEAGCRWQVRLAAHGTWTGTVDIVSRIRGEFLIPHHRAGRLASETLPHRRRSEWWAKVPVLQTADRTVVEVLRTSVEDLGTLRIFDPEHLDRPVVAAGSPWFMALFGRDSLISSMMVVALDTGLAQGTCQTLAARQGERYDSLTEEAPGRILHELRMGPAGTLALGGGSAYFGTADATALFVMTLGEILRWDGPGALTPELVDAADRALDWVFHTGDRDGDGFVEYLRASPHGLRNQGWKDSWDGVSFAGGRLAEPPIALAEVQGYVYAALLARAEIATAVEDNDGARKWQQRAETLRVAFDKAFWLPERGWYAVGLDCDKRPIDALTSSLGHLLWTGIAPQRRAHAVAERLLSPELFTGWGIRTLATSMERFDPMSYHNGSVWPHDTALCVSGLARYGFDGPAATLAMGLYDAAAHFGHRLPELFGGFDRGALPLPVPIPGACSPQAWAAAAPVELLRSLLNLHASAGQLTCHPILPERLRPLRLTGIPCGGRHYDLDVAEDGSWHLGGSEWSTDAEAWSGDHRP